MKVNVLATELTSCFLLHFRFHSFLFFLGYSKAMVKDTRAEDFCRTVSNFSLEYRTTRQGILLQRERERQKGGAESPSPHTPTAKRKHQQTPAQVFDMRLSEILNEQFLTQWLPLSDYPANCLSTRKMKNRRSLRRCSEHRSPLQDWIALCHETAGDWLISKVMFLNEKAQPKALINASNVI